MQATCAVISSDERTLVRNIYAPKTCRIFVRWQLERWGLGHLGDVTELIASELVTNAIQHGSGDMIGVRLECSASSVVIRVWDGNGDDLPQLREPRSGTDEHGMGLTITDALSEHWGSYRVAQGGKIVYAMITEALSDD